MVAAAGDRAKEILLLRNPFCARWGGAAAVELQVELWGESPRQEAVTC